MHTTGLLSGFSALLVTVAAAPVRRHSAPAALLAAEATASHTAILETLSAAAPTATKSSSSWTFPSWSHARSSQIGLSFTEHAEPAADLPISSSAASDGISKLFGFNNHDREASRLIARSDLEKRPMVQKRALFEKRDMRAFEDNSNILQAPPPNPVKASAFTSGMSNFKQHVANSMAAHSADGQAGIAAMWASQVRHGNGYARYYKGNGLGNPRRARTNRSKYMSAPTDDVTGAVLNMMNQVAAGPASPAAASAAPDASSTPSNATATASDAYANSTIASTTSIDASASSTDASTTSTDASATSSDASATPTDASTTSSDASASPSNAPAPVSSDPAPAATATDAPATPSDAPASASSDAAPAPPAPASTDAAPAPADPAPAPASTDAAPAPAPASSTDPAPAPADSAPADSAPTPADPAPAPPAPAAPSDATAPADSTNA